MTYLELMEADVPAVFRLGAYVGLPWEESEGDYGSYCQAICVACSKGRRAKKKA